MDDKEKKLIEEAVDRIVKNIGPLSKSVIITDNEEIIEKLAIEDEELLESLKKDLEAVDPVTYLFKKLALDEVPDELLEKEAELDCEECPFKKTCHEFTRGLDETH